MARLPDVTTFGSRPTPNPTGGIAGYQATTGAEELLGETLRDVSKDFEQHLDEINTLRAEEALNKLYESQLELTMGEKGFSNLKSGDAATSQFDKDYLKQFNEVAKQIENTLSTPEQKMKYQKRAGMARVQFEENMAQHKLRQGEVYSKQVFESIGETTARVAAASYANPADVAAQSERLKAATQAFAKRNGMDAQTTESLMIEQESGLSMAVLNAMMNDGNDIAAKNYFDSVKDRMTVVDRSTAEKNLDIISTAGEALRGADEIWAAAGPRGLNAPVQNFKMEQMVRDRWGSDPKLVGAIIGELRSRSSAHAAEQAEVTDAGKSAVLSMFNDGQSAAQVMQSQAYRGLAGDDQTTVSDYMQNRQYTAQQRQRAEKSYQDQQLAINGRRVYWGITADMPYLASLSEDAIRAMEPEIGLDAVGDLLTVKRRLNSPKKIAAAEIDEDLFKTIAAEVLPVFEKSTPELQEKMVRLKNTVEETIADAQSDGRKLTRDQKSELMRSIIDQTVMVDRSFATDKSTTAATVLPDERGDIYIPIKEIPPEEMSAAIKYLRSIGVAGQSESDQEITRRFQRRIERAVGIRQVGGTQMDAISILNGDE